MPIIDWTYHEVWTFLINYDIPFCKLYLEGYTYLGNKNNCQKNPNLESECGTYSPAFMLVDGNDELLSRNTLSK